jgi:hypothetical protein
MKGGSCSSPEYLRGLTDSQIELYASIGRPATKLCPLWDYIHGEGHKLHSWERQTLYALIGKVLEPGPGEAPGTSQIFNLLRFAEERIEKAPKLHHYLREVLGPKWEEPQRTLLEGIEAAKAVRLNDALVGPDSRNPVVPNDDRHRVYRIVGECRRGQTDEKEAMREVMSILKRYGLDSLNMFWHLCDAKKKDISEGPKPGQGP